MIKIYAYTYGNDGYEYAQRDDGVWFTRHGYYGQYGWARTKWVSVPAHEVETPCHQPYEIKKAIDAGLTSFIMGFHSRVYIQTENIRIRLPKK